MTARTIRSQGLRPPTRWPSSASMPIERTDKRARRWWRLQPSRLRGREDDDGHDHRHERARAGHEQRHGLGKAIALAALHPYRMEVTGSGHFHRVTIGNPWDSAHLETPAPQSSPLAYPANRSLQQHGRSHHRNDDDNGSDNQPVSLPTPCLRRPRVLLLRVVCRSLGGPAGLFFLLGFLKFSHGLPLCYGLWSWWLLPSKTSIA